MIRNVFLVAFFIALSMNAQIKTSPRYITVILRDSLSKEVVAYAAVSFGNDRGVHSDSTGRIKIPQDIKQVDVIHISYENKTVYTDMLKNDSEILLSPKSIELDEVITYPRKRKIEKIGFYKKSSYYSEYAGRNSMWAQFFEYNNKWASNPVITGVILRLNPDTMNMKGSVYEGKHIHEKGKVRIDLRLPDKETGAPSDISLIDGGIICSDNYKNDKAFNVTLPYGITFPDDGVFLVLEWILPEEIKENYISITPAIYFVYDRNHKASMWRNSIYKDNNWHLIKDEKALAGKGIFKIKTNTIACGLEIIR
jgi:hypothetical protein